MKISVVGKGLQGNCYEAENRGKVVTKQSIGCEDFVKIAKSLEKYVNQRKGRGKIAF